MLGERYKKSLERDRRLALVSGDANVMLQYFMFLQEENQRFFYIIDLNDEGCVRNIFWVDAKGRHDYEEFSFDTTYITNKYHM